MYFNINSFMYSNFPKVTRDNCLQCSSFHTKQGDVISVSYRAIQFLLREYFAEYCLVLVVKALCYKSEGRWFDRSWCHWNFSLT